jgi:hypothetical protein
MQLEDLTKSNLVTVAGLGLLAVVLPEFMPSMRPALKSALKIGISLFVESEAEAEAELIQSLVSATLAGIEQALSKPADEAERRAAVRRSIHHFRRKAHARAERWNSDERERHRSYRRHVAGLQAGLVERKQHVGPRRQKIIDEVSTFLAQEIG